MQPSFFFVPPSHDNTAARTVIKLSNTGTTESSNTKALVASRGHVLVVGAVPVYVSFKLLGGVANSVSATTALRLPAGAILPFKPVKDVDGGVGSVFVYVEAADGVSAYTVDIWQAE